MANAAEQKIKLPKALVEKLYAEKKAAEDQVRQIERQMNDRISLLTSGYVLSLGDVASWSLTDDFTELIVNY